MTTPTRLFRGIIAAAITDDLAHNQPLFEKREAYIDGRRVHEVCGYIDLARLGIFAANQVIGVLGRTRPGLMAALAQQPVTITEADVLEVLERIALPGEPYNQQIAAAIVSLVRDRAQYTPSFDDL